jgi:CheY-like chemotaxis protein
MVRLGHVTQDRQEHVMDIIERNANVLAQLVSDVLDVSGIVTGKIQLKLADHQLASALGAAVDVVRPAADVKNISLHVDLGHPGSIVRCDPDRMQQVFWNLLSNAVKFTPRQGKVHVVIRQVNSHVELSVIDNGKGIPAEFLHLVFERFRQADASTTRSQGGLGLGLAIAKHLSELHGGSLRAHSGGRDQGATFTLILPLLSAYHASEKDSSYPHSASAELSQDVCELAGIKVLVIEDEPDSADVLARILKRHGAEVRTAGTAAKGLDEFERFSPNVVLTDIGMPVEDGYEVIRKLRTLPGGRKVPIVALTALARSEDRTRALRAGFQMHVPKPVDAGELVAIVQNLAGLSS